jgi:predicted nucleotidyltransferase
MFNELNTLKFFFGSPAKEFNVREIARLAKKTPATISKQLKEFAKETLLSYRKERMLDLYKANLESEKYCDLKIYYFTRKLKESGLLDAINKFYLRPAIILFGSAAKGLDTENSDIDLVIISEKKQEFPEKKKFEAKLERELQMFIVANINELRNNHLVNNALNGRILQGEVEWT